MKRQSRKLKDRFIKQLTHKINEAESLCLSDCEVRALDREVDELSRMIRSEERLDQIISEIERSIYWTKKYEKLTRIQSSGLKLIQGGAK